MLRHWRRRSIPRKKERLINKSAPLAITDHAMKENHTIYWYGVKFPLRDTDWIVRDVKEAVKIKKTRAHSRNKDEGWAPPTTNIELQAAGEEDVTVYNGSVPQH